MVCGAQNGVLALTAFGVLITGAGRVGLGGTSTGTTTTAL